MGPREIMATITAFADALAVRLTNKELAFWGIVLAQLGETMGSIAAIRDLSEKDKTDSDEEASVAERGAIASDTGGRR
jgi:hypothetical protein